MPTIYSSAQWPLLQSLNEVKHKSGLFTCTATFLRPVGNEDLPTEIETSIGPVDVWPEPVVATGTDGFQTITATGYGVWDATISEVTYDYSADTLPVYWLQEMGNDEPIYSVQRFLPVIFESVHIRKIGDAIPPIPTPAIRILSVTGSDITNQTFNISQFLGAPRPSLYSGTFEQTIRKLIQPTMVKKNTFGSVIETEVTYGFIKHDAAETNQSTALSFGVFLRIPE